MQTKPGVSWLTVRLTEPNVRRLNATLTAIVKRAHACGLKAATIAHAPGEPPVPRPRPAQISLPDGVSGTVTVADGPAKLREFVAQISDLVRPDAAIEIDGMPIEFERQPVSS